MARWPVQTIEENFWEKVGPHDDPTKCWLWLGGTVHNSGKLMYGRFRVGDALILAHRFSYALRFGAIPEDMTIDHVKARGCTSTLCVNPHHLEVVTNKVNVLRGDGPTALNAKKTHCPQGHLYTEDNMYVYLNHRCCRICKQEGADS